MVLGVAEDFTIDVELDSELKGIPSSGLFLNSGVHPAITLENLLAFLPNKQYNFKAWNATSNYAEYNTSRNIKDIVSYNSGVYQSIKPSLNIAPSDESEYWLKTNIESLKIKSFLESVKDKVYGDLNLTRRLVNNQYLYEVGEQTTTLPNDYAAWVFEPKGSDYVSIRINEIALQKDSPDPVNVYIVNQKGLVDTLQVTPNKALTYSRLDYTLTGKGRFYVAIDSTDVLTDNSHIDPLKFDGFTVYTATGTGNAPQDASYSFNTRGNGLAFNISVYLDASKYIENNLSEFSNYIRAAFELRVFQMFLQNPNNISGRVERIQMKEEILIAELKNLQADTIVKRYYQEKKEAINLIQKTFDTHLDGSDEIEITVGSV